MGKIAADAGVTGDSGVPTLGSRVSCSALPAATTAGRPSASLLGVGAGVYDSTLSRPVWSDGAAWRDPEGGVFIVPSAGDGTADVTSLFQAQVDAAAVAGGGLVRFGPGTHIVAGLVMKSGVHLRGPGHAAAVLQLPNNANTDVIVGQNFAALTGTNNTASPTSFSLSGFSINGNRGGNTSGNGIRLFGRDFILRDLRVFSCANDGIYTEWANATLVGVSDSMECNIDSVKSHDNGGWGFNVHGPHDGFIHHSIAFNNGSGGFNFVGNCNGFLGRNCHTWGTQPFGVVLGQNSVKWDLCESETTGNSSYVCILVLANDCSVFGGYVYDPANTTGLIGIKLGDASHTPINTRIDVEATGTPGGAVNFSNSGGFNWVRLTSFMTSGTVITGSPLSTDVVDAPSTAGSVVVTPGSLGPNGTLVRDSVCANYLHHRRALPDPGGSLTWYKFGTWTATTSGSRLLIEIIGTGGYNADQSSVGRLTIVAALGSGVAPNIAGYFWAEGGTQAVTTVKAVATGGVGTGQQWDVYAQIGTFTGNSFVSVRTGTDAFPATWTWAMTSTTDPGSASSTVVPFVYGTTINSLGIQFGGHLTAGNPTGYTTTVAAGSNAGTSPTASAVGTLTDMAGTAQIVTGSGPSAGQLLVVTFANAYLATPRSVLVTPANAAAAALGGAYVTSASTTGFRIATSATPGAAATYQYSYSVLG